MCRRSISGFSLHVWHAGGLSLCRAEGKLGFFSCSQPSHGDRDGPGSRSIPAAVGRQDPHFGRLAADGLGLTARPGGHFPRCPRAQTAADAAAEPSPSQGHCGLLTASPCLADGGQTAAVRAPPAAADAGPSFRGATPVIISRPCSMMTWIDRWNSAASRWIFATTSSSNQPP